MIVKAILQTKGNKVLTIDPDATVGDAAGVMSANRVGALLVVEDGGRVAGVFSERDIVRGMAANTGGVHSMQVRDLMSRNVLTCSPEDSLEHIMGMMTNHRVRHLPVMEQGKLVGIITIGDVVKNRLDEANMEVDSLRNYVAVSR